MAVDFAGVVTFITSQTVIYSILAFASGMGGVTLYHRVTKLVQNRRSPKADDASVTEAVVMEYSRRLREYDRAIAELRTKLDIMELRSEAPQGVISQPPVTSRGPQPHVARITQEPEVTHHAAEEPAVTGADGQNGTTDYILKMLSDRPLSSREVQQAIGRTREHTARLMKKLAEGGLVTRDSSVKPFRYNLTDLGQSRLKEKAGVASELRSP